MEQTRKNGKAEEMAPNLERVRVKEEAKESLESSGISSETSKEKSPLERVKTNQILRIMDESRQFGEIQRILYEDLASSSALIANQLQTDAKFDAYHALFMQIKAKVQDLPGSETADLIKSLDAEMKEHTAIMSRITSDAHRATDLILFIVPKVTKILKKLQKCIEKVMDGETVKEVEEVEIPLHSKFSVCYPYPDVDQLHQIWTTLELDIKVDTCVQSMEEIKAQLWRGNKKENQMEKENVTIPVIPQQYGASAPSECNQGDNKLVYFKKKIGKPV